MEPLHLSQPDCGDCPIRHRAVCARCEPDELSRLDLIKNYRSYEAGQTVVWAGDKMEFVGSVVTGMATLSHAMEDGRTQMVGILLPSDFVGRPQREFAPFTVTAATDLMLCCFRKKAFERELATTPHLGQRLLEMMLDELDAAREWMVVLGRKTAREKIASLLVILSRRTAGVTAGKPTNQAAFDLVLTREAMADYLGLTLETVSRQISALRADGIIDLQNKRHVIVRDMARLLRDASSEETPPDSVKTLPRATINAP